MGVQCITFTCNIESSFNWFLSFNIYYTFCRQGHAMQVIAGVLFVLGGAGDGNKNDVQKYVSEAWQKEMELKEDFQGTSVVIEYTTTTTTTTDTTTKVPLPFNLPYFVGIRLCI